MNVGADMPNWRRGAVIQHFYRSLALSLPLCGSRCTCRVFYRAWQLMGDSTGAAGAAAGGANGAGAASHKVAIGGNRSGAHGTELLSQQEAEGGISSMSLASFLSDPIAFCSIFRRFAEQVSISEFRYRFDEVRLFCMFFFFPFWFDKRAFLSTTNPLCNFFPHVERDANIRFRARSPPFGSQFG